MTLVYPAGYEEIRSDIAYIRPDIIHILSDVGCHLLKYYVRPTLHPAVHEKARPDVTHIRPDVMDIRPDML